LADSQSCIRWHRSAVRVGWVRDRLMLDGTDGVAWGYVITPPLDTNANWLDGGSRPRPRWRGNKAYRWVSTAIDSGASSLMNTGLIMCDWNSHLLSHSDTHSLTRSATNIGGFDCVTGGRAEAP
jgi:hypothetical protein